MEDSLLTHRNHLNDNDEYFLLKEYIYNDNITITYSIIIPIYNQESIIKKNIDSIIKNTGGSFEIIIILDYCTDQTEFIVLDYFYNLINNNNLFYGIKIFKQPNSPIFEASCDNIGFIHSKGKYCLEIQADMEMVIPNYNLYLSKPFNLLNNVFAVSGRCAHNLLSHIGIGKLGYLIEIPIQYLNLNSNSFYVYDTCCRGPLLFDRLKLKELNYLDEKNYYLDDSDHDIICKAYIEKNYISGYVPIDFISPLTDGSTRNNNINITNQYYKTLRKIQKQTGIDKYKKYINKKIEIYDITNILPIL